MLPFDMGEARKKRGLKWLRVTGESENEEVSSGRGKVEMKRFFRLIFLVWTTWALTDQLIRGLCFITIAIGDLC